MRQPIVIALSAVPILIQVHFNAGLACWRRSRGWYERAARPRMQRGTR